jgi:hypothetical protein
MRRAVFNLSTVHVSRLGALLALLFALSSVSVNLGLTIISGPAAATISVDICHPLPSATASSLPAVARPATDASPALVLPELSAFAPAPNKAPTDLRIKPETPPPKAPA